jgi:hypothetical protein
MREARQANIPRLWKNRKVEVPEGSTPQELVKVPQNARYFAALRAVEFGQSEDDDVGRYTSVAKLLHYIDFGRTEEKALARKSTGSYSPNFQIDLIRSALADPFPSDLPAEVRSEVTRLLLVLKEAGWTVDPIQWESASAITNDKRVSFNAKSVNGKRVLSSCPEGMLPARLSVLLDLK